MVRRRNGSLEIVIVHRPVHQDWSFPKGKLEEGETFELAALREVKEETGMACRLVLIIVPLTKMSALNRARSFKKSSSPTSSGGPATGGTIGGSD